MMPTLIEEEKKEYFAKVGKNLPNVVEFALILEKLQLLLGVQGISKPELEMAIQYCKTQINALLSVDVVLKGK